MFHLYLLCVVLSLLIDQCSGFSRSLPKQVGAVFERSSGAAPVLPGLDRSEQALHHPGRLQPLAGPVQVDSGVPQVCY